MRTSPFPSKKFVKTPHGHPKSSMEVGLSVTPRKIAAHGVEIRGRKRRSSTSSSSLSPSAKENVKSCDIPQKNTNFEIVRPKRKRTKSESKQQLTFWGWSPKQAKFKPKIMNEEGGLCDHPNPESLALKSKWQPIVSSCLLS